MAYNATTGAGVAAALTIDSNFYTLSLSGVNTHATVPVLKDSFGTVQTATGVYGYVSRCPAVATVNATTGVVTGVSKGYVIIETSYPVFNNTLGLAKDGSAAQKCYAEATVAVVS